MTCRYSVYVLYMCVCVCGMYINVHLRMTPGYGKGVAGWPTEESSHLQTPHNGRRWVM